MGCFTTALAPCSRGGHPDPGPRTAPHWACVVSNSPVLCASAPPHSLSDNFQTRSRGSSSRDSVHHPAHLWRTPLGIQAPPIEPFAKSSMIPQAVSLWPGILLSASPFFVPSAPPALIALAHPLDICSVWFPHSGLPPLLRAPRVLSGPLCHINYFTVVFAALDVSQPTPKTTSVSFTSLSLTACHRAWHIALQ